MKVLVNGCSHLQGTDLHPDQEVSRQMTWPNYMENWQVTNIARQGASNDSIRRTTIDHLQNHTYDLVYVQWTHFDRIELMIPFWQTKNCSSGFFCINAGNAQSLLPNLNNNGSLIHQLSKSIFLEQFDETWFFDYNILQMIALQTYLAHRRIKWFFGFALDLPSTDALSQLLYGKNLLLYPWVPFCDLHHFARVGLHYEQAAHHLFHKLIETKIK